MIKIQAVSSIAGNSWITTKKETYTNFVFKFDFKCEPPINTDGKKWGQNAGCIVRGVTLGNAATGLQFEIHDNKAQAGFQQNGGIFYEGDGGVVENVELRCFEGKDLGDRIVDDEKPTIFIGTTTNFVEW